MRKDELMNLLKMLNLTTWEQLQETRVSDLTDAAGRIQGKGRVTIRMPSERDLEKLVKHAQKSSSRGLISFSDLPGDEGKTIPPDRGRSRGR